MALDQLIAWLNDAHAMEMGMIRVLQSHAINARESMPDAATRLDQHVVETRLHADRIEQCLLELGTKPSAVKSTLSSVLGSIEGVATGFFSDEPVKNTLVDFGAEQFEMACYDALITAARQLGRARIAELCELNRKEDEAMALWLRDQVPAVVKGSLRMSV
jgi:ferritin-like metal-binding protein YciE